MCKRPVFSDAFYQTINQSNVKVVPLKGSGVEGFTSRGLKYLGGQETDFDDVIFATGFQVSTAFLK